MIRKDLLDLYFYQCAVFHGEEKVAGAARHSAEEWSGLLGAITNADAIGGALTDEERRFLDEIRLRYVGLCNAGLPMPMLGVL